MLVPVIPLFILFVNYAVSAPFFSWMDYTCEMKGGICKESQQCNATAVADMPDCDKSYTCCVPNPYHNLHANEQSPDHSRCGLITFHDGIMDSMMSLHRQTRVVGGDEALVWGWPWQVALRSHIYGHLCGGTLINDQWVLTAAHCVTRYLNEWADLYLVMGDHYDAHVSGKEVYRGAANILSHPGYSRYGALPNDIALIKLDLRVSVEGHHVRTACLPEDTDVFNDQDVCFITGWGHTQGTGKYGVLNQLQVNITSEDVCRDSWAHVAEISSSQMCSGNGLEGACRGDSGGPLVCLRSRSFVLVGVTSWGSYTCQEAGQPTVYTKTVPYLNWIQHVMSQNK